MISNKSIHLYLFSLLIFFHAIIGEEKVRTGEIHYVLINEGAFLFEDSVLSDKKVKKLEYGSKIEVLTGEKKRSYTINGLIGNIVKVKYEDSIGYTFDGYLSKFPPPDRNCKNLQEYVDSRFTKLGKLKIEESKDADDPWTRTSQNYSNGFTYQTESFSEGKNESLQISNSSINEAFLIGNACNAFKFTGLNLELTVFDDGSKSAEVKEEFTEENPCPRTLNINQKKDKIISIMAYDAHC